MERQLPQSVIDAMKTMPKEALPMDVLQAAVARTFLKLLYYTNTVFQMPIMKGIRFLIINILKTHITTSYQSVLNMVLPIGSKSYPTLAIILIKHRILVLGILKEMDLDLGMDLWDFNTVCLTIPVVFSIFIHRLKWFFLSVSLTGWMMWLFFP